VSPIRTKIDAKGWLEKRLAQEGPGLWTDEDRKVLADQLAEDYRPQPGGPRWRVKPWTQRPDGTSVYVVTRGGVVGIRSVDDRDRASDKAEAIVRALNALDAEMGTPREAEG
jgi:hypothetical protein